MAKRTKGYRNGVRIVRFPGGRIARFHKPGTAAYAKGVAKKRRMGKLLAKRFGIKRRRGRGKTRRNPRQSGYASVEKQIKKVVRAIGKLPKHASSIRRLLYRRYDALLKKAEKFPEHWDIGPYN